MNMVEEKLRCHDDATSLPAMEKLKTVLILPMVEKKNVSVMPNKETATYTRNMTKTQADKYGKYPKFAPTFLNV